MSDLERLFTPESIAVVGATNRPGKMGFLVAQRLALGYGGRLHFVHPSETLIHGLPVAPDLAALPGPIDLVIAVVPADRLLPVIEACPSGHVRFLLTIPAGFGEVSAEGRVLQDRLVAAARVRGMRLVGPNTAGILNCPHGLNASLMPELPPGGAGLSCVTQSGGFGMSLSLYAQDHQLPVARFCDLGNTADVQIAEVLRCLRFDPLTRVVGLFLEAVPDGRGFAGELRALARAKPVIVTTLGRTLAGRRASFVHLGLEPGLAPAARSAMPEGVIAAGSSTELLDIAKGLAFQPRPQGRRTAILTGSGGIGSELADLAVEHGLVVPEAPEAVQAAVARHMPSYAGARNPIDPTPIWWEYPRVYPAVIKELLRSAHFDLVIVAVLDVAATVEGLIEALVELARDPEIRAIGKPVYVFWNALDAMRPHLRRLEAAGLPCYTTPLSTARTVAAIAGHAASTADRAMVPDALVSAE